MVLSAQKGTGITRNGVAVLTVTEGEVTDRREMVGKAAVKLAQHRNRETSCDILASRWRDMGWWSEQLVVT